MALGVSRGKTEDKMGHLSAWKKAQGIYEDLNHKDDPDYRKLVEGIKQLPGHRSSIQRQATGAVALKNKTCDEDDDDEPKGCGRLRRCSMM